MWNCGLFQCESMAKCAIDKLSKGKYNFFIEMVLI